MGLLVKDLRPFLLVSYWDDPVPWVVIFTVLGATMWMTRLRRPMGLVATTLALLWLIVAFTPLCSRLARDLVRRDPLQPADTVYVLGSGIQTDGELTTEAMSRVVHGLELLGQGLAPRIILPKLRPPTPSYAKPALALMKNIGLDHEVLTVGPTYNTFDEAIALSALFHRKGWKRVLLVTAPSHARRAAATFETAGLEVICSPSVETRFDLERLTGPGDRIRAFPHLAHELLGYWVYQRRGWIEN